MQAATADFVQPIINAGITLYDRLDAGEPVEWDHERAILKKLLGMLPADQPAVALGPDEIDFGFSTPDDAAERSRLTQAAIGYALTAWLDDFLSQHSTWGPRWRADTLEVELYGSHTSSSKFWDEARYAETRGDLDTLEVMYWCVMLGFRGDWNAKPQQLEPWAKRVRVLLEPPAQAWAMPAADLALLARDSIMPVDWPYRSMVFSVLLAFALTAPLALMVVWRYWTV